MAEDDIVSRVTIDASGTQPGAAQYVGALNTMTGAQEAAAVSAARATIAQNALAASASKGAASISGAAAAHRELAGALEAQATAVTFNQRSILSAIQANTGLATTFKSAADSAAVFGRTMGAVQDAEIAAQAAVRGTAVEVAAAIDAVVGLDRSTKLAADSAHVFESALGLQALRSKEMRAAHAATAAASKVEQVETAAAVAGVVGLNTQFTSAAASARVFETALGAQAVRARELRASFADATKVQQVGTAAAIASVTGIGKEFGSAAASAKVFEAALGIQGARAKELRGAFEETASGLANAEAAAALFNREGRHIVALFDELARGQRGAMVSSLGAMARDSGLLQKAFVALAGPWGAVVAGIAAAGAGMGYLLYVSNQYADAVREVGAANLLTGQGGIQSAESIRGDLSRLADQYGITYREARHVLVAFAEVTGVTNQQRFALANLAVAQATLKGTDATKTAEALAKVFEGSGKSIAAYGEKLQLITPAERAMLDTLGDAVEKSEAIDKITAALDKTAVAAAKVEAAAVSMGGALATGLSAEAVAGPFGSFGVGRAVLPETSIPGVASSGSNVSRAMEYFQSAGLTRAQAAGVVGTLQQESGTDLSTTMTNASGHTGIAQWSRERQAQLGISAKSSLDEQLAAIVKEWGTTERSAFSRIIAAQSPQAAALGMVSFERPEGYTTGGAGAYISKAQQAAAQLYAGAPLTKEEKIGQEAVDAGSKARLEELTLQNQINAAEREHQKTLQLIDAAESAGRGDRADELRAEAQAQAAAIKELELRQSRVHTGADTDRHNEVMRNLRTEAQAFGLTNEQILSIAQREAAEIVSYGRNTAAARGEASFVLAAAEKKISEETLRDKLHAMQLELVTARGATEAQLASAEAEREAIIKVKGLRDPSVQQKELEIARLKNQLEDEEAERAITALKIKLAEESSSARRLEITKQIHALEAGIAAHAAGGAASASGKQRLADAEAERAYTKELISEQLRLADTRRSVDQRQISMQRSMLDARTDEAQVAGGSGAAAQTRHDAYTQELALIQQLAAEETRRYQTIIDNSKATDAEKERAYGQQLEIASRAAEQEMQLAKKVADEQKRQFEESAKVFRTAFSSAGSAVESAFDSVLTGQKSGSQVTMDLVKSLMKDTLHTVTGFGTQKLAESLGGAPGKGLSELLGDKVARLFGIEPKVEGEGLKSAAQAAANEELATFATILERVNALLDKQSMDVGGPKVGATSENLPTVVPAAAGGMAVGRGGLAILHPQETVLPPHISAGFQRMISSMEGGGIVSALKGTIVSNPPTSTGFFNYGKPLYEQLRTNDPGGFDPKTIATSADIAGTVKQGANLEVISALKKVTPTTFSYHPSSYTGQTGSAGGLSSSKALSNVMAAATGPAAAAKALTDSRSLVKYRETIDAANLWGNILPELGLLGGIGLGIFGLSQFLNSSDFDDSTFYLPGTDKTLFGGLTEDQSKEAFKIPSGAGGMTVDDGKGGQLAILHPDEMVLPARLSIGVQRMLARGGRLPSAEAGMVVGGDAGFSASFGSNLNTIAIKPSDLLNNTAGLIQSTSQNFQNTTATIANTLALQKAVTGSGGALPGAAGSIFSAVKTVSEIPSVISGISKVGGFLSTLFLREGGIVSAAGGMLVGGGQLSILHPREMVLPAPLSQGMQNLIEGGGRSTVNGGDVNLSYAPTINAPGNPSLGDLLERHSQTMVDWIHSNVRSGTLKLPAY